MKVKFIKTAIAMSICLMLLLVACDAMSTRTCNLAAQDYVRKNLKKNVLSSEYNGYYSVIVTTDSIVYWVESDDMTYPYVTEVKTIADFRVKKSN